MLYLSFTQYNLFKAPEWVGLDNYKEIFSVDVAPLESREQRSADALAQGQKEVLRVEVGSGGFVFGAKEEAFWRGVRLTLPYAFLSVPLGIVGALGVALLLNQKVKGLSGWRVLNYIPAILPPLPRPAMALDFRAGVGAAQQRPCAHLQTAGHRNAGLVRRSGACHARVHHHQPVGRFWREFRDLAGGSEGHPAGALRSR
jgi:hypothetical protein